MDNWLAWDGGPATTASWVAAVGLAGLLGTILLEGATGGPDWLLAWRIATLFLLYAGTLVVGRHLFTADPGSRTKWELFTVRLGLLAVLLAIVYQSGTPGVGLGVDRVTETTAIYGVLVAFCVLADDPREYSQKQWLVLWCLAGVVGTFFYHGLAADAGSLAARRPLWAAVIMGVCLAVLPRYLPSDLLLWTLSRVSAVVVILGLATYAFGEYTLLGLQFRFHGSFSLPVAGRELPAIRSLLVHRNAFAVVAVSGLLGAVAEIHRIDVARPTSPALAVPTALLVVNAVGVIVSAGRAVWFVGAVGLGIYLAYVGLGRDAIPAAVVTGSAVVGGGILAVSLAVRTGYLAADPSDRFHLWAASLAAILDRPSLLGEGTISTARYILPYRDGTSPTSPRNSYLSIWIRTGLVGGLAYLGLNVASVLEGVRRYRGVDVAVLALAATFVAHQLFEAYTLFSWSVGSVFASLAIGFLAFGVDRDGPPPADEDGPSRSDEGRSGTAAGTTSGRGPDDDVRGDERSATRDETDPGSASRDRASPPVVSNEDDETSPVPAEEDETSPVPAEEDETSPVPAEEDETSPVPAEEDETSPVPAEEDES